MKDPHVHVERGIGQVADAQLREAFTAVTGVAVDAPKTVTTGCGRRRPYVMTSVVGSSSPTNTWFFPEVSSPTTTKTLGLVWDGSAWRTVKVPATDSLLGGDPAAVTCLACREHAATRFDVLAGIAEAVASLTDLDAMASIPGKAGGPAAAAAQARGYRARAAAFRASPRADGN